jgi:hypothetical protein
VSAKVEYSNFANFGYSVRMTVEVGSVG